MANFGIMRFQKLKLNDLGGMRNHLERMGKSSNNDIDSERTKLNYDIDGANARRLVGDTNRMLREVQKNQSKAIRKDAVVMIDTVVTASPEKMNSMTPDEQKQFFNDSVRFLGKQFGWENIAYAKAHMDEATPHIHVGIFPKEKGRLCAKNIFSRQRLTDYQDKFFRDVSSKYGMERGVKQEEKRKHLSTEQFKRKQNEAKEKEIAGREAELVQREKVLGGLVGEIEVVGRLLPLIADAPRIGKKINGMVGEHKRAKYRREYAGAVAEIATALKNVVDEAKECDIPVPTELGKSEDFPKCWALMSIFEKQEEGRKAMLREM